MGVVNIFTFSQCESYVIIYFGFTLGLGLVAFKESSLELVIRCGTTKIEFIGKNRDITMDNGLRFEDESAVSGIAN